MAFINRYKILFVDRCDGRYISSEGIGRWLNSSWHICRFFRKNKYQTAILSSGNNSNYSGGIKLIHATSNDPENIAIQIKKLHYNILIISSWPELLYFLKDHNSKKIIVFRGMRNRDRVLQFRNVINKHADAVVAVSSIQASLLRKCRIEERLIEIIPNGIDHKIFKPKKHKINNLFIYIGALSKDKGSDLLFKCFYLLHKQGIRIKLIICGSEKIYGLKGNFFSDRFKKLPNITLKGLVSQRVVANIMKKASFCILPTNPSLIFETFSKSIHEAMYMGCLPIVSTSGNLPDVIKDGINGFVFKNYTEKGLVKKIREILYMDKSQINKIKSNMIKIAKKEIIDWSVVAKKFLKIIDKISK
jgi:glycosyltransferase involved in cell wall biosynthesis